MLPLLGKDQQGTNFTASGLILTISSLVVLTCLASNQVASASYYPNVVTFCENYTHIIVQFHTSLYV